MTVLVVGATWGLVCGWAAAWGLRARRRPAGRVLVLGASDCPSWGSE